eukprot:m.99201 g.99201  ORF g.99201 m.99201 type:complete len:329 (-) comp13671_c0_seq5:146-1132(-)
MTTSQQPLPLDDGSRSGRTQGPVQDPYPEEPPCCSWECCKLVCWIFCCPPCPASIISKQAFMPPKPVLYAFQEETIWIQHPENLVHGPMVMFSPPIEVKPALIQTPKNYKIACYYLRKPNPKFHIIFSHGNAVDIGGMAPFMVQLSASLNCSVLAYDYAGYGLSGGIPREKNQYNDIKSAYDYLVEHYKVEPSKIILYGQSIGSSPTTHLASLLEENQLAGVILHSALLSGIRVLRPNCQRTICVDPFQNINKISKVKAPTLILHGGRDDVVPMEHGSILHELSENPVEPLFLPTAGHDDIEAYPQYLERLKLFMNELVALQNSVREQ